MPWSYALELCVGVTPCSYALELRHGVMPWSYALELCLGVTPCSYALQLHLGVTPCNAISLVVEKQSLGVKLLEHKGTPHSEMSIRYLKRHSLSY